MKKLLYILGIVFVIVIAAIGSFIGYAAYNGNKLDASSANYIKENIPPIISNWNPQELIKRSSPEFQKVATENQIDTLFGKLSKLGGLKTFGEPKGEASMSYTTQNGNQTTATYHIQSVFKNGEANLEIKLIQHDGQWQILGFHVSEAL
jgi:hypothetical protein